jgi:carbon monoxide dehydrogenase subunit G
VFAQLTVAANGDEVWDMLTDFDHMAQILQNCAQGSGSS